MIPDGACFRRAEGLWFHLAPCAPDTVRVTSRGEVSELDRAEARLLARLDRWQRADELGVAPDALRSLVARELAFWSAAAERPRYALGTRPVDDLARGAIALAEQLHAHPMLARDRRLELVPHMPRLGRLDGTTLGGVRLDVCEWDVPVATAVVACCARHAAILRGLVPRLDGRHALTDLDADERAIAHLLDDVGLLAARTPPWPWDGVARVTWLGHASVLYEAAGQRILIDPDVWPRARPTRLAVSPHDPRDLGELDAVLITHGDSDHCSPNALLRIDPATPVVIPRAATPRPYHVDMAGLLARLGFTDVRQVSPWDELRFGDVAITATPFRGEDWGLSLPTTTYLVASSALTVLATADSLTDEDACDRIARSHAVDLALVGVTGAAEAHVAPDGFGYGDFYAPWIAPERRAEWVTLCNGPREAADVAHRVGARWAFGYAAGGAPFTRVSYPDRGTHAELAAELAARGGPTRPLELAPGVATIVPR